VRLLEQSLGYALFKPAGRGIALTDAGVAAMTHAEQIFQLGEQLPDAVREAATGQGLRLAVGISDGLPKLVVRHLLQPALEDPRVRLLCHEDEFDRLLADLALHKLDAVLSDRGAPTNPNLRLYSHALGEAAMGWFAPAAVAKLARNKPFPACLGELPLLLPTSHAAVRPRLDQWLERERIRPCIAGEFEDSALLAAFGRSGMGAFPASHWSHEELLKDKGMKLLGECEVLEHFWLISAERRIQHPLVQRLVHQAA
jgi:LysR family transcriptional activator of nhaA